MARESRVILLLGFVVLARCSAGPDAGGGSAAATSTSASASPSMTQEPDEPTPSESSSPPMSSIPPSTPRTPLIPPQKPSDAVAAYWTSGTVVRGGDGPCYGVTTDAGVELALYTRADVRLVEGEQIRVRVREASFRIDCGPGQLVSLLTVERG